MKNEYYTSTEISAITGLSQRQITYRAKLINATKELLYKDTTGQFKIHRLLLPRFKKKEKKEIEIYAFSSDLPKGYTEPRIIEAMSFMLSQCNHYTKLEYSIEQKDATGELHIHSILTTENKTDFYNKMKESFGSQPHKYKTLFDRELWLQYITKYGTEIITITNKKTN